MEKPATATVNRKSARPRSALISSSALAELSPSTSLSRLAEHVQMPASKVHRYLQALIASGFAEQNAATTITASGREALRVGAGRTQQYGRAESRRPAPGRTAR